MDYFWLIFGLVVLIVSGEFLVKGAVNISAALKISPLVIGMTVVSFGTSAPELLVSLQSAFDGNPGIAIGNVVGSNIANLALVLGITVLIFPIVAEKQTKRLDYPFMLVATFLFALFCYTGLVISNWEGLLLFFILIVFTAFLIYSSRRANKKIEIPAEVEEALESKQKPVYYNLGILMMGLIGLYFGSDWFVAGAVNIARSFDLSDSVIGVTVVAFGTSAPELVASIVAAFRKQTDISVGNLIGSNIFNILAVIGITGSVKNIDVDPAILEFDIIWAAAIALLLAPMLFFGEKIGRFKGLILLLSYVVYITWIVLRLKS